MKIETTPLLSPRPVRRWLALILVAVSMGTLFACRSTVSMSVTQTAPVRLVAGTYNTQGSQGIYGLTFNPVSGSLGPPELLAAAENPSWITVAGPRLYVANELEQGRLSSYALAADGRINLLGSTPTLGAAPCYIAVSPDRKFLASANYVGGNFSVFTLDAQGVALPGPQILRHDRGPSAAAPAPYKAAHGHWMQWSKEQDFLYSVDLGLDEVNVYPFDQQTGRAGAGRTALKLRPGDGPRHMYFHPHLPSAYILNELSSTITVVERQSGGQLAERQRITTLPADFTAPNQAAHLYVSANGKHLYASNRGHNSIAVYAIAADGSLSLLQIESVKGKWPRNFLVLESHHTLLVANQGSNNIVAFNIGADGALTATGQEMALPQITYLGQLN